MSSASVKVARSVASGRCDLRMSVRFANLTPMEWLTVAIGIGLLISFWFSEAFGLSVGGMIVPGYLAVSMDMPAAVALTLVAAGITFGIIRVVGKYAILFGRRRVVVTILVGFFIASLMRSIAGEIVRRSTDDPIGAAKPAAEDAAWAVIGFVIPGLIALGMDRAGVLPTLAPLVTAAVMVNLALVGLGLL